MKQKIKNFLYEKIKLKIIISSILVSFLFLFSLLMVTPGLGLESKKFINSIEKQIKEIMPQGKYVVDGNDVTYEQVMNTAIKSAYTSDAISTLNSYEDVNYAISKEAYTNFSNQWFENRWGDDIKNHKDIDLYDLGIDLIKFDQAVATKFLSFGYVNAGIQWMFKSNGLNQIFSSSFYQDAKRNQTIIDQETYDSYMSYEGPGLNGITVKKGLGTLLVNNKVWFLNRQIENIKFGFNIMGHSIFKDKSQNENNMAKSKVTYEDLSYPFFTNTLTVLRIGIVLFFIFIILVLPIYITFLSLWILNSKKGKNK
ncbi:hypothetical protein [Spiroplasma diminutum]|uniref:Transmembrane protein n=1 Tax=Spiroplasma diminutum CUAS-1 TaxID=1276221 RepID=S5M2A2_9MOLU|nr:hypothetical protein [Spiroplasma diminutum]AGR42182.1 hypothetical protein SDIMI_v3c04780 [Spiroplasma diminutum CUAS-1]